MTGQQIVENIHRQIVEAISMRWGLGYRVMPEDYGVSYAIVRDDEAVAWMEVAVSDMTLAEIGYEGGFMFPLEIWNRAHKLSMLTYRPFLIALKTVDGGYLTDFRRVEYSNFRIVQAAGNDNMIVVPVSVFLNFRDHHHTLKP